MVILGISLDDVAANRAFADKFGYNFPLLCDTERNVALAYGAVDSAGDQYAARYTFVIGADGVLEQAIDTKSPGDQAATLLAEL